MRLLFTTALLGATLTAAPFLAWSENMPQPASDQMAVWAYPSKANYCPSGLQPVVVGGVICCGQPTHAGYQPQSRPWRKNGYKPAGTNFANGKGYGEDTVVYQKGQ